jgi:hypothetical protein
MWRALNAHRIDALGVRKGALDLIECRLGAGPGALGSLLTYATLWRLQADRPLTGDPVPVLVTDRLSADGRLVYARYNVVIHVV